VKLATLVSLAKSEFHHYLISWWEVRGIFLSPFFVAQQTNPSLSLVVEVSSSLTDRHRHTHTHTSGRTPLYDWSARRRGRNLHNTQQIEETNIMPHSAGFELAIPAIELSRTDTLDSSATRIG